MTVKSRAANCREKESRLKSTVSPRSPSSCPLVTFPMRLIANHKKGSNEAMNSSIFSRFLEPTNHAWHFGVRDQRVISLPCTPSGASHFEDSRILDDCPELRLVDSLRIDSFTKVFFGFPTTGIAVIPLYASRLRIETRHAKLHLWFAQRSDAEWLATIVDSPVIRCMVALMPKPVQPGAEEEGAFSKIISSIAQSM